MHKLKQRNNDTASVLFAVCNFTSVQCVNMTATTRKMTATWNQPARAVAYLREPLDDTIPFDVTRIFCLLFKQREI